MNTIWKYNLTDRVTSLKLPKGFNVVSTAVQHGAIAAWVQVDPDEYELVSANIKLVATGDCNVNDSDLHIGTLLFHGGNLVEHVYLEV